MTNTALEPELWQHLVQWQPATAAALAAHIRSLPDDWPMRVFGVGRADAAFLLPPGATGEQFPDRAPEIAPYDEIAPLDDCPACTEAEGNCRFHEGFAAGHHEAVQAQLDAVKAQPGMGLREFMRWRADVEEAEDRGQEPPAMPVPAAAPAAVEPPADQAALRDRIAAAIWARTPEAEPSRHGLVMGNPHGIADAVLAVLPEPADRAAVTPPPTLTEEGRLRARIQILEEDAERNQGLAKVGARCMREGHQGLIESGRAVIEGHRFALSVAIGLGTGAPWDAIHERVAELRRMADETATTETRPESCAHCGKPVRRITGTLATWWVHDPGGNTVCHPEQAASSPRATPKAAILHAVPLPGSNGISACCGRPPCEFVGERVTRDPDKVTCTEPAAGARQDGAQS